MTSRKLTLIVAALLFVTPLTLLAQPPEDPGGPAGRGQGGLLRQLLPPPGYLQITDEQRADVEALAEVLRDAVEALRADRQDLGSQLENALNADEPEPTAIGQLTLDLRAVGEQIRAELESFGDSFRALLDADQQTKWDNYQELRRLGRRQGERGAKALHGAKLRRLGGS